MLIRLHHVHFCTKYVSWRCVFFWKSMFLSGHSHFFSKGVRLISCWRTIVHKKTKNKREFHQNQPWPSFWWKENVRNTLPCDFHVWNMSSSNRRGYSFVRCTRSISQTTHSPLVIPSYHFLFFIFLTVSHLTWCYTFTRSAGAHSFAFGFGFGFHHQHVHITITQMHHQHAHTHTHMSTTHIPNGPFTARRVLSFAFFFLKCESARFNILSKINKKWKIPNVGLCSEGHFTEMSIVKNVCHQYYVLTFVQMV